MAAPDCVIQLFGSLSIGDGEGKHRQSLSGAAADVFAYLLTFPGREVRRERLADMIWTDLEPQRSRAALNTAVWRINKLLKGRETVRLRSSAEALALETGEAAQVDTRRLESAVRAAGRPASDDRLDDGVHLELAAAVEGCAGPFLDGSSSDWAIVERERLHALHLRGLTLLMQDSARRRDYDAALERGRAILAADPFREQVQCEVMQLYMLGGRRAAALRQYENYRRLLTREMGIAPMVEIRALAEHIRGDGDGEAAAGGLPMPAILAVAERARLTTYRALAAGEG